jgi:uncharacterized protein YggU (UPF0235/DUF167 family)
MNKNILITTLIIAILIFFGFYIKTDRNIVDQNPLIVNSTTTQALNSEKMDLVLYVQNKDMVENIDCSITEKITVQVTKTEGVANAALEILFSDELKDYGVYKSVEIASGTAKVILESDMTSSGYPINSLSSCQSGHLMSVLKDTLTQYDSIDSVKLYSPKGEISF